MLKLGVMGMSEGNGHPYSWSAIINGDYDPEVMEGCGYETIPRYLEANVDTLGVDDARVTHIWTQERKISEHCAAAAHIENVVDNIEDFIGRVDAVLLARDDPRRHVEMARPLIDAGMPIFIDKPLAITREDLEYFTEQVNAGRLIMSWSSMRFSAGVRSQRVHVPEIGDPLLALAVGKKDWIKYGIHYLEGMFALLNDPPVERVRHVSGDSGRDVVYMEFRDGMKAVVNVFMDIAPGKELNIYGTGGCLSVDHGGAYPAFRTALVAAIQGFRLGRSRIEWSRTRNVIGALIAGQESLEAGGETVAVPR